MAETVDCASSSGNSSGGALDARLDRARRAPHLLAACGLLVALTASACTHHVRLTSPDTDPGARYVCGPSGCRPADEDVPSDENPSGITDIVLPRECAGKFHRILILDAGSSEPSVRVTCAPPEEPIGTMGEPEASNAAHGEH